MFDDLTISSPLPRYLPFPKFLLDIKLSHTAKLLYALLLDRATLSRKNNWTDEQDWIYVIYPIPKLAQALGCSFSSVTRSLTELTDAGLIERTRSGFSKPSRIFLKIPHTAQNRSVTLRISDSPDHAKREQQEVAIRQQKHSELVRRLKAEGFSDTAMLNWTFENDNGHSPQMHYAHRYVERWQTMRAENLGLLLWGSVGTGKSFLAGCIANALMEQEVPVRMTNFARIMNELNSSFSGRNAVVDRICRYPLLIIDDFGMERGTAYALEQVYNIVDSRYRSQKPLIVTTNLTLDEIRHPQDTAHARIYDRILEMCVPISCIGASLRKENAQKKLESMKSLIG